jgi:hypothetical protein
MSAEAASMVEFSIRRTPGRFGAAFRSADPLVFAAMFAIVILTQLVTGAYTQSIGGYADEPGHFMSGLLIRDYIAAGLPWPPMSWAEAYYAHHPTLGIGYWPPLFYMAEAGWMLLFGYSRTSMLLFIAVICAALQYLLFRAARNHFGFATALGVATALPLIPAVAWSNSMIMTDVFVTLVAFAATLALGRCLETPSLKNGLLFGMLFGLALLTKLSAAFVLLAVPLAIVISRRFDILRRPALWIAAAVVCVTAGPWFLGMSHFTTRGLLPDHATHHFFVALKEYGEMLYKSTGPIVLVLAVAGGVVITLQKTQPYVWAAIAAHTVAVALLLAVSPVYMEARYAIAAMPAMLLLAAMTVSRLLAGARPAFRVAAITLVCLSPVQLAEPVRVAVRNPAVHTAAKRLSEIALPGDAVLVSSDRFEGAMVAELATLEPRRPGRVTLRASKVFADMDWNATRYNLRFGSDSQLEDELRRRGADFVLIDGSTPKSFPHHLLLRTMLETNPEWVEIERIETSAGICSIFRRTPEAS